MPSLYEEEEISIPLIRQRPPRAAYETSDDEGSQDTGEHASPRGDRMRPGSAGALTGLFAGAAAFGLVHALHPVAVATPISAAAAARGVDPIMSFVVAYVTAAALGGIVGALFAIVTRYLRRYIPLLLWALVFFGSLTMLLLAIARTYAPTVGVALAPSILGASAVFAFVFSFSLPIRRRSS